MTTSHSLLPDLNHKANITPARWRAHGSFHDAILKLLHSVNGQYNRDLYICLHCKAFLLLFVTLKLEMKG